ncbi:micronuclear linker histone polyprotein-like [Dermacentor albipictus]|uniref:micronuclear linker histone polyprotein-like n=1 Tax=Dermacentor albipictus TaxID=60249 RepID=UPI0038FD2820
MAGRHSGTGKRRASRHSPDTGSGGSSDRDAKRRKSKRQRRPSSSDTSGSTQKLARHRAAKRRERSESSSSRFSSKKGKSKKRRHSKSSSGSSGYKSKRKTRGKHKSSSGASSHGSRDSHNHETKKLRRRSGSQPEARRKSEWRKRDTESDAQSPSSAVSDVAESTRRATKRRRHRSSSEESNRPETPREEVKMASRSAAEKKVRPAGIQTSECRAAVNSAAQEGDSFEAASNDEATANKKRRKRKMPHTPVTDLFNALNDPAAVSRSANVDDSSKATRETPKENNDDRSDGGREKNQAAPDVPPTEGSPLPMEFPDLAPDIAELLLQLFLELLLIMLLQYLDHEHPQENLQ